MDGCHLQFGRMALTHDTNVLYSFKITRDNTTYHEVICFYPFLVLFPVLDEGRNLVSN